MKYLFFLAILILSFFSCRKETMINEDLNQETVEYLSQWKLYSHYMDNGGGSGGTTYYEDDNYLIRFLTDSTLESNNFEGYANSTEDDWQTYGYDSIHIVNYPFTLPPNFLVGYQIIDTVLTINHPCIEPCVSVYYKID